MSGWLEMPLQGLSGEVVRLVQSGKIPASIGTATIEAAVNRYATLADAERQTARAKRKAPSKALRKIETLMRQADTLAIELARLPDDVSDALFQAMARHGGRANPTKAARDALGTLAGALELARREIDDGPRQDGRPPAARAVLVLDLAAALERAGVAEHKAGGPLCVLLGMVLRLRGERTTSVWQIVRTALKLRPAKAA
jgi:hypothetical protein